MPSHRTDSAFVKLYTLEGRLQVPWSWPRWQEITGIKHGLFPSDDSLLPGGWTREDANDVVAYFKQYSLLDTEDNKIKFAAGSRAGAPYPGREKWHSFINNNWEKWKIHSSISEVFREQLIHPIDLLLDQGSLEPWPNADIYIPLALDGIGLALFGIDAFEGKNLLPMDVRKCVTIFAQRSWTRIRKQVRGDIKRLETLEKAAIKAFEDLDKAKLTRSTVLCAIRAVSKWKDLITVYGTEDNILKAGDMMSEVERLLECCGAKVKQTTKGPRTAKPLFKRKAKDFSHLATAEDLEFLIQVYEEYFNDASEFDEPLVTPFSHLSEDVTTSDLGMEKEGSLSLDVLAARIGFSRHNLPHQFAPVRHVSGLNSWTNPDLFSTITPLPEYLVPNQLHWHQIAGVHSVARNIFTATPDSDCCTSMLISDEVGLGKTALAISVIAFLNQVILLQEREQDLPPVISESKFLGDADVIEPLPHLIVTPGTLRAQWVNELQTLFLPHSVDILLYDSPKSGNSAFWDSDGPFQLSKQRPQNKIILTTHSTLLNQMNLVYQSRAGKGKRPWDLPAQKRPTDGTIFHQRYLTVVIDEMHEMRNLGPKYYSGLRLFQQATVRLGLTGTPLLTAPKDISAMARLIGVPYFLSQASIDEEKDDNAVYRKARKYDDDGQALRQAEVASVVRMQGQFAGHILRRTTDSKNWLGKPLIELPPAKHIIGTLILTERERAIIQERAEAARASVISANESGRLLTKKFYHEYRRAVSYAQEDPNLPLPTFQTLAEWDAMKSTKMDVCAKICSHYLADDNVSDVDFKDGAPVFPTKPHIDTPSTNRKILIYSESPSMTSLMIKVLKLYGISSLSIDGSMSFEKRDKVVSLFHAPDSARVLIFSSVGAAGLNLSVADVVIYFNQVWSSQDAMQILGRAHRQPQKKTVKAIHILADESSDLLLNAIALRKRDMFDAFVSKEAGQELLDLLCGKVVCRPGEDVSFENFVDENTDLVDDSAPKSAIKKPVRKTRQSKKKQNSLVEAPQNSDVPVDTVNGDNSTDKLQVGSTLENANEKNASDVPPDEANVSTNLSKVGPAPSVPKLQRAASSTSRTANRKVPKAINEETSINKPQEGSALPNTNEKNASDVPPEEASASAKLSKKGTVRSVPKSAQATSSTSGAASRKSSKLPPTAAAKKSVSKLSTSSGTTSSTTSVALNTKLSKLPPSATSSSSGASTSMSINHQAPRTPPSTNGKEASRALPDEQYLEQYVGPSDPSAMDEDSSVGLSGFVSSMDEGSGIELSDDPSLLDISSDYRQSSPSDDGGLAVPPTSDDPSSEYDVNLRQGNLLRDSPFAIRRRLNLSSESLLPSTPSRKRQRSGDDEPSPLAGKSKKCNVQKQVIRNNAPTASPSSADDVFYILEKNPQSQATPSTEVNAPKPGLLEPQQSSKEFAREEAKNTSQIRKRHNPFAKPQSMPPAGNAQVGAEQKKPKAAVVNPFAVRQKEKESDVEASKPAIEPQERIKASGSRPSSRQLVPTHRQPTLLDEMMEEPMEETRLPNSDAFKAFLKSSHLKGRKK